MFQCSQPFREATMSMTFATQISRCAGAAMTALALAACGGGGSDAPTTAATTTFPLAAAMANFERDTSSKLFTITGTGASGGQTVAFSGNGSISSSLAAGTFEGVAAQVKTLTTNATLTAQGKSVPLFDTTVAFYDANYQVLGSSTATSYCVRAGSASFPSSAKVGDTGTWYSATCYTNSTKAVRTSTGSLTFAIEPLTAASAILRISQKSTPLTGAASTQDLTYTITTAGAVTPRETPAAITSGGVTVSLTFKFL
jgi:hypothetical protein